MPALLSSRRPPQLFREQALLQTLPISRFDVPAAPLPAVAVPRVGAGYIALACLIVLSLHGAGFLWLRDSAPAQPLPPVTQPMPIAMQMVAAPKPPTPSAPAAATPPIEQAPPLLPPTPVEPPKPVAAAAKPKPAAPHQQPAKPQAKPTVVEKSVADAPQAAAKPSAQPQPPQAAAAPPGSEPRTTAPIGRAGYLNNPPPVYPPAAAKRRQQGTTLLRVHVLASGHPDQVEVAQSSGFPALDDAAKAAVRQWSFTPAKRGDTPVDGWVNVPLAFTLAP
ncbi:TonB domain-containing protein [Pseudomonas syringae pv. cilantro]|uniref:TonB domain-containing protein n=2 Tax=Pseudomonas syringae group TaxID=136849 RepID=A0A0N0XAZ7_PSESX|nr:MULTISPECIES: energy transducer TonB [Pseudomonas syringae group]KPC33116.1 TonB domain-containing protein [Pseudomonas syringae pv. cilantro]KPW78025.1 TonB domain-containing protein [Pseudomonas syringae pv. coriandricola]RMN07626.1 TonB domain-containing protein [Pseudomonas syringae pv. coriandricola]